jgi:chloramphenicol-sensitive protein RarD
MNRGIVYTLSAYIFWGLQPIYWKALKAIPAGDILAHRIIWSFFFFIIVITQRRGIKKLFIKLKECNNKWILFLPAVLIGSNWGTYIWAINAGHVVETSLGYFISPLISVFLGVIFLNEQLRKMQWFAVAVAATGVIITTVLFGRFPWISLFLAVSWGLYGLLRKKSPLDSAEGLMLETAFLFLPAIIYLGISSFSGTISFFAGTTTGVLLIGTGIISGLPLLVFISGARMISLSLSGILQYIYPTLIFITGVYIYNESLDAAKMTGFIFIWIALIIYSLEGSLFYKRKSITLETEQV